MLCNALSRNTILVEKCNKINLKNNVNCECDMLEYNCIFLHDVSCFLHWDLFFERGVNYEKTKKNPGFGTRVLYVHFASSGICTDVA